VHVTGLMMQNFRRIVSPASMIALAAGLVIFACAPARAQGTAPNPATTLPDPRQQGPDKSDRTLTDFGDPTNEMRTKLLIKADKKQYEENVARAKEADDIASGLRETYESKKAFSAEDEKKLERLEKLAKRIRNEAGGSDSDTDDSDPPTIFEAAVKKIANVADNLRKEVEKTPRHVVSAAVISQANRLIGLIQFLRKNDR
jgi:hypothetical protein